MGEYLSFKPKKRQEITKKIKQIISKRKEIVFAFVFGSFLDSPSFRDIDIGVYVKDFKKDKIFDYELELSKIIANACNLPFDIIEVKVLNLTPNSFLNNIFSRGKMLFSKNDQFLSNIIENTSLEAVANEYIAYQSLKELVPVSK